MKSVLITDKDGNAIAIIHYTDKNETKTEDYHYTHFYCEGKLVATIDNALWKWRDNV